LRMTTLAKGTPELADKAEDNGSRLRGVNCLRGLGGQELPEAAGQMQKGAGTSVYNHKNWVDVSASPECWGEEKADSYLIVDKLVRGCRWR